jgi:hypothetical protein
MLARHRRGHALQRRDLNDLPGALLPKLGQRRAGDVEHAEHVGVELAPQVIVRQLLERAEQAEAGVVHHHVDALERFECGRNSRSRLVGVRHVESHRQCATRVALLEIGHAVGAASARHHSLVTLEHGLGKGSAKPR